MRSRSRIIAIAAGALTVTAIVLAFASTYLGVGWLWLRPAAELLLLAELVGLVVLERRQLFEPVHEKVSGLETHVENMRATLNSIHEKMGESGQVTVYLSPPEVMRTLARVTREALARGHEAA
jgi:hypothetical protein